VNPTDYKIYRVIQYHEYESLVSKFEEIKRRLLKTGKAVIQHLSEMMLFLNYSIISGSAEALVRCGGKLQHLLIAYFIGNTYAKHYDNQTTLS